MNVPVWVQKDRVSEFVHAICNWADEFNRRWDYDFKKVTERKRPAGLLVEAKILEDLRILQNEWGIKETEIRCRMVDVHAFLPLAWRINCFKNWEKVHSNYFNNLIEYLGARHADRWLQMQPTKTQALLKPIKSVKSAYKKIKPEDYKRFAFVLFLTINIFKHPAPVTTNLVKKLSRDHNGKFPIIWKERVKLIGRRISEVGKAGQLGIIEYFLQKSSDRKTKVNRNKFSAITEQEKTIIGLASVFHIEKIVRNFEQEKTKLGEKFSADIWLRDYMNARKS